MGGRRSLKNGSKRRSRQARPVTLSFSFSFSFSHSFSHSLLTTFPSWYGIRPVFLNAERMVESFNTFCLIDLRTSRNLSLLKFLHLV